MRSQESKDLINRMLTYNAKERITAKEALKHPWFKKELHPALDQDLARSHLKNLMSFRVRSSISLIWLIG